MKTAVEDVTSETKSPVSGERCLGLWLVSVLAFVIVVGIGVWMRTIHLDQPPIWDDERTSLLEATGQTVILPFDAKTLTPQTIMLPWTPDLPGLHTGFTPADVWAKNTLGNVIQTTKQYDAGNGLLFSIALHGWIPVVGLGDASLKALPVSFGIATLVVLFLGFRCVGLGLFATTVVTLSAALHPLLLWSSRELRPYSLAALFAVVATLLFIRLVQRSEQGGRVTWLAVFYGLSALAALFSHYMTVSIFAGHAIWAALTVRDRRTWAVLVAAGGFVVAVFGLWLATGGSFGLKIMAAHDQVWLQRAEANAAPWLKTVTVEHIRTAFLGDLVGDLLSQNMPIYEVIFSRLLPGSASQMATLGWQLFAAALIVAGGASLWSARIHGDQRARLRALMMILMIAGPSVAALAAFHSGHTLPFIQRYMVFSAPFAAVFLGLCLADIVDRAAWSKLFFVAVLPVEAAIGFMSLFHPVDPYRLIGSPDPKGDSYFNVAAQIAVTAASDDLIVYANPTDAILVSLYLKDHPNLKSIVEKGNNRAAVSFRHDGKDVPVAGTLP